MNIVILGGGTYSYVRNHLSLCALAFGTTARCLKQQLPFSKLILTRMASETSRLITNEDVEAELDIQLSDPNTGVIILNSALCDFDGKIGEVESGNHTQRLESKVGTFTMVLTKKSKLIDRIKHKRPDIIIVGFKTTTDATEVEMLDKAERMGVDICLANDTVTRSNILVVSETCKVSLGGMNFKGTRKATLETLAGLCSELQGRIKYNSDKELIIDLQTKKYITKDVAFKQAISYSQESETEFCETTSGWSDKEEGVFILKKKVKEKTNGTIHNEYVR